ncbi:hypothetical protein ACNTMW_15195 [Planosporangium sp. 12N6]|uniref:hypothetical protein n=1 Tax=Planosporangium spinosum TaxID=3402278 RepID=UPI003CF152D1
MGRPPDDRPGVSLAVYARSALDPAEITAVERAVSRWLGLDDDVSDFLAVARADPAMAPVLAVTAGLHQVRFPSLATLVTVGEDGLIRFAGNRQ